MTLWIVRVTLIFQVLVGSRVHYIKHFLLHHFRVLTQTIWAQLDLYLGPFPAEAFFPKYIKLNGFACKTHGIFSLKEPSPLPVDHSLLPSFACNAFHLIPFSFLSFSLLIKARAMACKIWESPLHLQSYISISPTSNLIINHLHWQGFHSTIFSSLPIKLMMAMHVGFEEIESFTHLQVQHLLHPQACWKKWIENPLFWSSLSQNKSGAHLSF